MPLASGADLLETTPEALYLKYAHKIVHQTTHLVVKPKNMRMYDSWSKQVPDALHVLWTDAHNDRLVKTHYPQFAKLYDNVVLNIQRVDIVRLLYLHRYGGLYADIDYEAKADPFLNLPTPHTDDAVFVVESPIFLNEVQQNSLMAAKKPGNKYWLRTVEGIDEIWALLRGDTPCHWNGCAMLVFLRHPLIRTVGHIIYTQMLTGSSVLDKVAVRYRKDTELHLLEPRRFFVGSGRGGVATHYHDNSWSNGNMVLHSLVPLLLILLCSAVAFAALLWQLLVKRRGYKLVRDVSYD